MSLIASSSGNVKIWIFDGARVDILANSVASAEDTLCVRWNHTNQVVGAGTSDGNIHLQHASTAQILSTLSLKQNSISGAARSVAFSSNSRYLASAAANGVHIWDLKRRSIKISLKGHIADVGTVGFAAEGQVVSGDEHGVLKVWDINRGDSSNDMKRTGRMAALNHLEVSSAGQVACGYADGCFTMWDAASLSIVSQYQDIHSSPIASLAISPKNPKLVVTSGADGRVNLIDTSAPANSKPTAHIEAGEQLTSVSFQENAIHSAIGTQGGNIMVYDWRHLAKPLCKIPGHNPKPVLSLAFQVPGSRQLATSRSADSSSSVGSGSRAHQSERAEPAIPARHSPAKETNVHAKQEKTPVRANEAPRREFPDALVREEVSELSFASAGSVARGGRSGGSKTVEGTPTVERHAHIDPRTEAKLMTGTKNTLYNSNSSPSHVSRSRVEEVPHPPSNFSGLDNFDDLKKHVNPATSQELQEMYQLLRYDVHREVQSVIREQVRQFEITKDETAKMMSDLKKMLGDVLQANKELREENEKLRRIY